MIRRRRSQTATHIPLMAAFIVLAAVAFPALAFAEIQVSQGSGYEIWTITGMETYDLQDGEVLSNVLVDQSADGATLTIRSRNRSGWVVRNIGFVGVGQDGDGGNSFQFQVSAPSGGTGLIENIWMSGKARDGLTGSKLGGIYIRSSHAGHIDIRHTYIEGFGNNAVYGSAVGKDSGNEGTILIENAYHRDNTVSQFRIGSPGSIVRNSVGIVDDPQGLRGYYPSYDDKNARGIWGKHFPGQRIENSSFYISPDDVNWGGGFAARYISGRSRGSEAVLEVVDCNINADAPQLTQTTSNATVNFMNLGNNPTVTVIGGGGVPMTPEMAAMGQREMPPELPGATPLPDEDPLPNLLEIDGTDADRTDYSFTVDGDLAEYEPYGGMGTGDSITGNTAQGFVNGGTDGYAFSGSLTDFQLQGNADVYLNGVLLDPDTCCNVPPDADAGTSADMGMTADAGTTQPDDDTGGEEAQEPDAGATEEQSRDEHTAPDTEPDSQGSTADDDGVEIVDGRGAACTTSPGGADSGLPLCLLLLGLALGWGRRRREGRS